MATKRMTADGLRGRPTVARRAEIAAAERIATTIHLDDFNRSTYREIIIDIDPMGAVRMTQRDKWKPTARRYLAWKDAVRRAAGPVPDAYTVVEVEIVAFVPMAASWSRAKKARLRGRLVRQRPDVDNIAKGVLDALWPRTDAAIGCVEAVKYWADTGSMVVRIWSE